MYKYFVLWISLLWFCVQKIATCQMSPCQLKYFWTTPLVSVFLILCYFIYTLLANMKAVIQYSIVGCKTKLCWHIDNIGSYQISSVLSGGESFRSDKQGSVDICNSLSISFVSMWYIRPTKAYGVYLTFPRLCSSNKLNGNFNYNWNICVCVCLFKCVRDPLVAVKFGLMF